MKYSSECMYVLVVRRQGFRGMQTKSFSLGGGVREGQGNMFYSYIYHRGTDHYNFGVVLQGGETKLQLCFLIQRKMMQTRTGQPAARK